MRYPVEYYQLGEFLSSTEGALSYSQPIIIHASNQGASTGAGGVGNDLVLSKENFLPNGVRGQS